MAIDLKKIKKIHLIGIKGVGMSALALMLKGRGLAVTGSDVAKEFITDKNLKSAGIPVFPFRAENISLPFSVPLAHLTLPPLRMHNAAVRAKLRSRVLSARQ